MNLRPIALLAALALAQTVSSTADACGVPEPEDTIARHFDALNAHDRTRPDPELRSLHRSRPDPCRFPRPDTRTDPDLHPGPDPGLRHHLRIRRHRRGNHPGANIVHSDEKAVTRLQHSSSKLSCCFEMSFGLLRAP